MSLIGKVDGVCPAGCEPAEYEVVTFVSGHEEEDLRLALLACELNLVMCQTCSKPFFPDTTLIYSDLRIGMTAFVFPESYKAEEAKWRTKMAEDYSQMRGALGSKMPLASVPEIFFGYPAIAAVLQAEDDREDEAMVADYLLKGLGLTRLDVDPAFARARSLPRFVPLKGKAWSVEAAKAGVDALLKANDRLVSFAGWRDVAEAPPRPLK